MAEVDASHEQDLAPANHEVETMKAVAQAESNHDSSTSRPLAMEPPEILRAMTAEQLADLETRVRRKIDFRLLPMMILMYVLNYIDR